MSEKTYETNRGRGQGNPGQFGFATKEPNAGHVRLEAPAATPYDHLAIDPRIKAQLVLEDSFDVEMDQPIDPSRAHVPVRGRDDHAARMLNRELDVIAAHVSTMPTYRQRLEFLEGTASDLKPSSHPEESALGRRVVLLIEDLREKAGLPRDKPRYDPWATKPLDEPPS